MDIRYKLEAGEGADSVHSNPEYSYAVTQLLTDADIDGIGLALFTTTLQTSCYRDEWRLQNTAGSSSDLINI